MGGLAEVSLLLPIWDAEATLAEALSDVCAQVEVDFEAVLVLDGPRDRSAAIAYEFASRDRRLRVLERPHEGLVAALNAGLGECRAPIVARFDADDRMAPDRLAVQVAALRNPEVAAATGRVDVVACDVAYATVDGGEASGGMLRHAAWLNGLDSPERLALARFIDAPVAHPAVAYRREVVLGAGGYRQGDFAEDHELWLRLFERGIVFGKSRAADGAPRVTWRDRGDRLTRVDGRYGSEARRALVHRYLLSGPLSSPAGRRAVVWGAGEYGRWHARHLLAAGARLDAFIDIDPKKVGRVLHGLSVMAPEGLGAPDGRLVLVAVASPGARAIIAARLAGRGYREGEDWLALQ